MALSALRMGHEPWYIGMEDFTHNEDGVIRLHATTAPGRGYRSAKTFLAAVQGDDANRENVDATDFDVIFLRNDPAEDREERPWAQNIGILFGQAIARTGVLVVNDPGGLAQAMNKMYLEAFPEEVRPRTLTTRNVSEIRRFVNELDGGAVIKPLQGSGGESVFLVKDGDAANLNQMIEAVSRYGYLIVQEYLPAAAQKDTRLFLMNGDPIIVDGVYAALHRVGSGGDIRNNITAGGKPKRAKVTDVHLRIAEAVRPRLIDDGMFLVGLDIAGAKIMEINVFSPGGLHCISDLEELDFCSPVIEALERKVAYRDRYGAAFANERFAML
jgi:glutathione synthase